MDASIIFESTVYLLFDTHAVALALSMHAYRYISADHRLLTLIVADLQPLELHHLKLKLTWIQFDL